MAIRLPQAGIAGLLLILLLVAPAHTGLAQDPSPPDSFNIARESIRFPYQSKPFAFQIAAGLSLVQPPKDLVEQALQAPLVNIHMTYGLPWHLSLEADLTTILVSNQLALGPRIGYGFRNFHFNAGYDIAFVYGQLKQAGFNNSTMAWIQYPNLTVGYKLKNLSFTLKGEVVSVMNMVQKTGEKELSRSKNFYNGFTVAFYLEQRLTKKYVFTFGLKNSHVKYYWPTWMLFSTFNRYYNIPELSFSWIL